jgi:ABC-2 type transport system ATP-binding protein
MQKVMRDFVRDYNKKFGATIILTSHYMDDVKELCKRVIIIDHGKKLFDGNLQDIIDKYAKNKILSVVFSKEVSRKELEKIGEIKSMDKAQATILVPRKDASKKAAELLQNLPVADLNIEEPSIEAIIRDVFQNKG